MATLLSTCLIFIFVGAGAISRVAGGFSI